MKTHALQIGSNTYTIRTKESDGQCDLFVDDSRHKHKEKQPDKWRSWFNSIISQYHDRNIPVVIHYPSGKQFIAIPLK